MTRGIRERRRKLIYRMEVEEGPGAGLPGRDANAGIYFVHGMGWNARDRRRCKSLHEPIKYI